MRCGTSLASFLPTVRAELVEALPFLLAQEQDSPSTSSGRADGGMKREQVFQFFRRLAELNPEPETELEYKDPYTLLVAVALSAQATDVSVNLATRKLFKIADTPANMGELGEEGVKEHIKTIGLFNTKTKNVIALSRKLLDDFGGEVPRNREALESLPG